MREPLTAPVDASAAAPDWIIIGAATGPGGFQPAGEWVQALEAYADAHDVPLFHKDNLTIRPQKRREWPDGQSATRRQRAA